MYATVLEVKQRTIDVDHATNELSEETDDSLMFVQHKTSSNSTYLWYLSDGAKTRQTTESR